jgi:hypothetical protein
MLEITTLLLQIANMRVLFFDSISQEQVIVTSLIPFLHAVEVFPSHELRKDLIFFTVIKKLQIQLRLRQSSQRPLVFNCNLV